MGSLARSSQSRPSAAVSTLLDDSICPQVPPERPDASLSALSGLPIGRLRPLMPNSVRCGHGVGGMRTSYLPQWRPTTGYERRRFGDFGRDALGCQLFTLRAWVPERTRGSARVAAYALACRPPCPG